jgi:hypothetical protein
MKLDASDLVVSVVLIIGGLLLVEPELQPAGLLDDHELKIPADVYNIMVGVLEDGTYVDGNISIDASKLQTIQIGNGRAKMNPPIEVRWKFLRTTVEDVSVQNRGRSILVDVNRSPIDLRIVPGPD